VLTDSSSNLLVLQGTVGLVGDAARSGGGGVFARCIAAGVVGERSPAGVAGLALGTHRR